MKITAVIPTLNEEADLHQILKSLDFVDDILVVDSGSTDNTVKIAREFGATVLKLPFKNYAATRNWADRQAKQDWILSIDADVVIPPALAREIKNLPPYPAAYKLGRINLILGQPLLYADWGPKDDNQIRFYHRAIGHWQGDVHEQFITDLRPRQLKQPALHHNYRTLSEFIIKLNHYSDLEANRRLAAGQKFSFFNLVYQPLYDFGKRYIYKLGFLAGLRGLFICLLQAIYHLSVNIKLYRYALAH